MASTEVLLVVMPIIKRCEGWNEAIFKWGSAPTPEAFVAIIPS